MENLQNQDNFSGSGPLIPKNPPKLNKTMTAWLVLVIILVLSYGYLQYAQSNTPYLTLSPTNYPEGTAINLYKNVPPGFPPSLILENKTLDYSGVLEGSDGKKQITVSYISDKSMSGIMDMYLSALPKDGWSISDNLRSEKASIIQASKVGESLIITVAPVKDVEVMVTFQYEQPI